MSGTSAGRLEPPHSMAAGFTRLEGWLPLEKHQERNGGCPSLKAWPRTGTVLPGSCLLSPSSPSTRPGTRAQLSMRGCHRSVPLQCPRWPGIVPCLCPVSLAFLFPEGPPSFPPSLCTRWPSIWNPPYTHHHPGSSFDSHPLFLGARCGLIFFKLPGSENILFTGCFLICRPPQPHPMEQEPGLCPSLSPMLAPGHMGADGKLRVSERPGTTLPAPYQGPRPFPLPLASLRHPHYADR